MGAHCNAHNFYCMSTLPATMPGIQELNGKRHVLTGFTAADMTDVPIKVKVDDKSHTVYIDGCKGTPAKQVVVQIEGKFNALTVNNCERFAFVFDSGVSTVEIINSKK